MTPTPPLYGLVLAGGQSIRMGEDKGLITYHGKPQREHLVDLLTPFCVEVFVSLNAQQDSSKQTSSILLDEFPELGPLGGIWSAMRRYPTEAWLVVACDVPLLSQLGVQHLAESRDASCYATVYYHADDGQIEPLISIWEPACYAHVQQAIEAKAYSPKHLLNQLIIKKILPPHEDELWNVNDPESQQKIFKLLEQR
ncbi:MAG: molybdenum cofactor guanylyltransferase [Spirosomataceae bacterium]